MAPVGKSDAMGGGGQPAVRLIMQGGGIASPYFCSGVLVTVSRDDMYGGY